MNKKIILVFLFLYSSAFSSPGDKITGEITSALKRLPSSTDYSILIINPLTEDTLFAHNPGQSRIPASNTKLFTTSTALSLMGGDYCLSTKLLTDGTVDRNGVINGNLYIKGYGNSVFTEEDLIGMVEELKRLGITKITGNIIGDDSFFDEIYSRDDWIRDEVANVKLPPISALVLDRNRELLRRRIRTKRGRIITRSYYYNVKDPPLHAASVLRDKLKEHGIKVSKPAIKGVAKGEIDTLCASRIRLRDLIKLINKHSDNFLAECLFKTIGAYYSGSQGNSFYSTQAVIKFIKDNGIFSEGTSVVDGSGISRFDQVTVGAVAGLLEKMYFDMKHFQDFYNSLSIAGVDGTLRHRMKDTAAEDNFHGKTGTLKGVSSLSGYLKTQDGNELVVSMMFEFKAGGTNLHREIEDRIVEILAGL